MLTTKAYLLTWGIYLLAAVGLLAALFRLTRGWRPVAFRVVLRAVAVVWLLMPAVVEPNAARESLAPAFMVLMFELTGGFENAARVLQPMLILTVAVIPLALAMDWGWTRWRGRRPQVARNGVHATLDDGAGQP